MIASLIAAKPTSRGQDGALPLFVGSASPGCGFRMHDELFSTVTFAATYNGCPQIFANGEHGAEQGYYLAEPHAHPSELCKKVWRAPSLSFLVFRYAGVPEAWIGFQMGPTLQATKKEKRETQADQSSSSIQKLSRSAWRSRRSTRVRRKR